MNRSFLRTLAAQPALRISLAVLLIVIGLAPVGAPILSDSSWRATAAQDDTTPAPSAADGFSYRIETASDTATQFSRSDDDGTTWHAIASIPENVVQVQPVADDEQVVYALSDSALWVSRDGGSTWTHTGQLPSRPLSLAVTSKGAGAIFVGTESIGLAVSRDGGASWQVVNDATLTMSGMAPIAVTALALDSQDESILYATTAVWTGTSTTRLTPVGTFVSLDSGRVWLQMDQLPLSGGPITQLHAVEGRSLAVMADNGQNVVAQEMKMSPELLAELNSADPAVRASVARALGLLGDAAAAQPLFDRLNDDDILVGDRVVEALAQLNSPQTSATFINALNSDQEATRARAAYGLGLLRHEAAVDSLAERLRIDQPAVARRSAEALARIGTPAAMTALTIPLSDNEMTPARHAAMAGLEEAGANATNALVVALGSENPTLRSGAAEMLGWTRSPAAVDALANALQDEQAAVRSQAAWALGEIGTTDAREALVAAQSGAADEATRTALANAEQRALSNTPADRPTPAFSDGFIAALGSVPATSWTFAALFLALALALLLLTPRRAEQFR